MDVRDARAEYRVGPAHAAGEIPRGYKLTEIGVIPKDWDVKSLGEVCLKIQDGTHFSPAIRGGEYLYVTSKNVGFGALDVTDAPRIDESQHRAIYKRCDPKQGDLLLTKDGASTGNAALNTLNEEFSLLSSVAMLRFDERKHNAAYFLQQILSSGGQRRISEQMSGNAITRLTLAKINRLNFPVCELAEQRSIAEALSDASALLGALDRLIAKKRDLKQAAMQQLLTGQTRLPGFHGEWKVKTLGEVFLITVGTSKSSSIVENGDHWIVDMGSVSVRGELLVSKQTNLSSDFLCVGDLVMPKDDIGGGGIIGRVGYIDADKTYVLGDHVYCLRATEGDPRFFAYLINSQTVNHALRKKAIGSAQLGLGRRSVTDQEIAFPDPGEQAAIAAVLSDIDAEIKGLEARSAKTRDLKQAMMQELLTGRTRLI